MAERKVCTVRNCVVALNKRRYEPVSQAGWAVLHEFNTREALVVYNPADPDRAALLDKDGFFLASLQAEHLMRFAPADPETQQQIANSMAMRLRLEKGNRQAIVINAQPARSLGVVSPLESMAKRLRLTNGETGQGVVTQRATRLANTGTEGRASVTPAQAARMFLEEQKNK